jgi:hypothetical protein
MSKATGLYAKEKYPEIQITIPSFLAVRRIKSKQWVDRRLSTLQNTNPYLRVTYEEFSRDNQSSLDGIFAFLGFDPIEITKGREKQSGREVVVNSEELRQLVQR